MYYWKLSTFRLYFVNCSSLLSPKNPSYSADILWSRSPKNLWRFYAAIRLALVYLNNLSLFYFGCKPFQLFVYHTVFLLQDFCAKIRNKSVAQGKSAGFSQCYRFSVHFLFQHAYVDGSRSVPVIICQHPLKQSYITYWNEFRTS